MATYLDALLTSTRERVAAVRDAGRAPELKAAAEALLDARAPRRLHAALSGSGVSVVAEVKRASPSKGELAPGIDALTQAGRYLAGGASAR